MNRRELVGLMGLPRRGTLRLLSRVVRGSLIGVWTLQNCVRTFPDGHKEYPFGEKTSRAHRIRQAKAGCLRC